MYTNSKSFVERQKEKMRESEQPPIELLAFASECAK
jgi:hypothetical protein